MATTLCLVLLILVVPLGVHVTLCVDASEKPKEKPEKVKIKIVDAPASRITPFQAIGAKDLKLRIKPADLSGPTHLQQLARECLKLREKGYKYEVCPFHNITQKEERVSWNSFHGVLGVWREWLIENDTFVGMHYVMGQECSIGEREVKLLFNCSTVTRLHNASEPSTCHYIIWLDTPFACFKGAMQVYHLLTDDQLKLWKQYDDEYYADELTFQGLTKRRRKLLTEAGLLFDQEAEKARLAEEKRQREEEEKREREQREREVAANRFKSPLSLCEEERDQLKKDLEELTAKIRSVIRDYPAVAYRLGFLQNTTTHKKLDTEQESETGAHLGRVEDERHGVVAVEEVLTVMDDGGPLGNDEREWSRGGFLDHDQAAGVVEEEGIINEINREVDERDMGQLKQEMSELQRPQETEGERVEEEEEEGVSDEQLLELIEEMRRELPHEPS